MAFHQQPHTRGGLDHPVSWPKVAVIVLNWNGWQHTIECLESLQRLTYPSFEIIVVDNGSNDGSVGQIAAWARGEVIVDSKYLEPQAGGKPIALEEYDVYGASAPHIGESPLPGPLVLLLKAGANRGFTGGNNIGIWWGLQRGAEFVFLVNNDAVVEKNVLSELVKEALRAPEVGMIAPTVLRYADPSLVDRQGIVLTKGGLPYERRGAADGPLFCPDGCAALYRRSMLLAVAREGQYFDEEFFAYCEDVDLGIRARRSGFTAALVEQAVVYHKMGSSLGGPLSPMGIYLRHRNILWMLAKDLPVKVLVKNALWILVAQIGTLAWNLATPARAAVVRGKLDGVRGLWRMWCKRQVFGRVGDRADLPMDGRIFLPRRRLHLAPFRTSKANSETRTSWP